MQIRVGWMMEEAARHRYDWLWRHLVRNDAPSAAPMPIGIVETALDELLGQLLHSWLQTHEPSLGSRDLTSDQRAKLARRFSKTRVQTMKLLDEAEALARVLDTARIRMVVVKGAALALTCYRDPGMRPMVDVDALVTPADFFQSVTLALAHGWRTESSVDPDSLSRCYAVTLARDGLKIDLHQGLAAPTERSYPVEPLLARAKPLESTSSRIWALRAEDLALHMLIHWVHHAFNRPLLAWADLARLFSLPRFDWGLFSQAAKQYRLDAVVARAMGILSSHGALRETTLTTEPDRTRDKVMLRALQAAIDPHTARLRFPLDSRFAFAFVTMPILDGPAASLRWLARRALGRMKLGRFFGGAT